MGIREDIKMLLAKRAMTMTKLAAILSERGQKTSLKSLSNKLTRGKIPFCEVKEILDIIGYDIEYKERH